jgi:glycosyltransferase involved in cell wall biosynthesis
MKIGEKDLKVALVHDFLVGYGGAERALEALGEMYPEAPIYTLLYDKAKMRGKFEGKDIRTSFLQKFPGFMRRRYKWLLPFMPTAPETFDLRDFDLVISSSGAWSKGIVTRLNTIHISYLHSPMRYAWDMNEEYLHDQKRSKSVNFIARLVLNYVRLWDKLAADRPDYLVANSKYTQERINKYYGKSSQVIYPPIVNHFNLSTQNRKRKIKYSNYFLIVSRLVPYKKIDAVIEAFNKLSLPLLIIGEGGQKKYLKSIAGETVKILGWRSDQILAEYYRNARAFIFPAVDDFGIAPVEAMSFGVPVLAIRKGGIIETVDEGQTGEFFNAATPEVIADCIRRFMEKEKEYSRQNIADSAKKFSKDKFIKNFRDYISKIISNS